MSSLPTELIYILAFAAFALVQYLLNRFGALVPHDDTAPKETLENFDHQVKESPAASVPYIVDVDHVRLAKVLRAPIVLAHNRFDMTSMLVTKRDMQNAIVLATILGPCRAHEPHHVR